MRSTFSGLEIAKRSLFTQQAALQTTGHNIANANTQGYSRQTVNMVASQPLEAFGMQKSTVPGQMGQGVEFTSVTRIREGFLDDQYRNENKSLGRYSIEQDTLGKLETVMNEPSDTGIRKVLDNFWNSWSDLSKDPENLEGRKVVRENALALADAFNSTSKQLGDLNNDLTANINVKTNQINTYTSSIASLNSEISRIEGLGDDANDLRDQRDQLTDELSKIVNVSVQNSDTGYTISMGSTNLVNGDTSNPTDAATLVGAFGSDLTSGEMYGLVKSRDTYVKDYQDELDNLANTIANGEITVTIPAGSVLPEGASVNINGTPTVLSGSTRVFNKDTQVTVNGINGLHKLGYLAQSSVQAGGEFFTGTTAATFGLNANIVNDPSLIATSMRTTGTDATSTTIKGNNTLALLMGNLKDTQFKFSSKDPAQKDISASVDDYLRSIAGELGVQSQEAQRQLSNQQTLVDQVDSRRQSVSGVSLDEEMSNMIKFQHAYSAAARVMTTFDETLDKVINSMGVVGR